jgi:hypothetical protein
VAFQRDASCVLTTALLPIVLKTMNFTLQRYERLNPRCEIIHKGISITFCDTESDDKVAGRNHLHKGALHAGMDQTFDANVVPFDIGANLGMYSIWAPGTRRCQGIAFEPEAINYAPLIRNIQANNLQNLVKAHCIGWSDRNVIFDLNIADMQVGGSKPWLLLYDVYIRQPIQSQPSGLQPIGNVSFKT